MNNNTNNSEIDTENEIPEPPNVNSEEEPKALELESLKTELKNSKKEYLYLRAEFDNFRKHSIKEHSELIKFGGEAIARDLLTVLDVFQKALEMKVSPKNFQSFLDGVKLTEKELKGVFSKHGISEIDCKNKPFNPSQAEALSQFPSADIKEGLVYNVMRKGYFYHEKVLRHAQVIIATKPVSSKS